MYRAKGYGEDWIIKRIKGIQDQKKLTDVWKDNGVTKEIEFAILTNEIYHEWSGMNAKEYKEFKGLRKESLRDNMSDLEVLLADIGETTTRELAKKHKPQGLEKNREMAKCGGKIANLTIEKIEEELEENVITQDNNLNYIYSDKKEPLDSKCK